MGFFGVKILMDFVFMKTIFWVGILLFFASCSGGGDIEEIIYEAIKDGKKEAVIPSGRYVLDEPIELNELSDLLIRADGTGRVEITSGLKLSLEDFNQIDPERGIYEITIPELIADKWPDSFRGYAGWPELFLNGEPLTLARFPNSGYIKIDSIVDPGSIPREGDSTGRGGRFISREFVSFLRAQLTEFEIGSQFYLDGYWKYKWYDEVIRVESIDTASSEVVLAAPHNYGLGPPSGGLFYGLNQPEYLDHEGEYYFDQRSGILRFIMPAHLKGEKPIVTIGYQDFTLFSMNRCKNIVIQNVDIADHNGYAFEITDSDSVLVEKCSIRNMARSAIRISGGRACGVTNSMLEKIGGTGISLDGGDKTTLTSARHFVIGTSIFDFSRHIKTYSPAIKLDGTGHLVQRNTISNGPHCAIFFTGNDHLIQNNHIQHVCLNTSDAGAIYCGRDWTMGGTVIRQNSIQQLGQASHHHNWAIYLDDLASGIDVIENIIVDCPSAILVGGGRYNRIIGNHITNCPKASIMYDARGLGWASFFVNDPTNIMWERLAEVPVNQPPWSTRFPWLRELQDDDPAVPKNVEIKDNEIFHSAIPEIHETVYQYGIVQLGNDPESEK